MIFETERTGVRRWTDDDADRVFDILRRDEVVRWLGSGQVIQSREEPVASESARGELRHGYEASSAHSREAAGVDVIPEPAHSGPVEVVP